MKSVDTLVVFLSQVRPRKLINNTQKGRFILTHNTNFVKYYLLWQKGVNLYFFIRIINALLALNRRYIFLRYLWNILEFWRYLHLLLLLFIRQLHIQNAKVWTKVLNNKGIYIAKAVNWVQYLAAGEKESKLNCRDWMVLIPDQVMHCRRMVKCSIEVHA